MNDIDRWNYSFYTDRERNVRGFHLFFVIRNDGKKDRRSIGIYGYGCFRMDAQRRIERRRRRSEVRRVDVHDHSWQGSGAQGDDLMILSEESNDGSQRDATDTRRCLGHTDLRRLID